MLSEKIKRFNANLQITTPLTEGVEVLNPFLSAKTRASSEAFFDKFYADNKARTLIFGINPGRMGAGITGVPFTDPFNLEKYCGIENPFEKKRELSSDFIYQFIEAYGGVQHFYSQFLFTAMSPLGFVRDGKNINYYDLTSLQKAVEPFILNTINEQLNFGVNRAYALCLGEGANFKYFQRLNTEHQFFQEIIPLAHPRYILQYKRKMLKDYIQKYIDACKKALLKP